MAELRDDDGLAALIDALVKTAQTLLANQCGAFLPFAAFLNPDGKVEMLGADLGGAQPRSGEVIAFLRAAFESMAQQGRIKGMGICANVVARLPGHADKVDAICCFVDRLGQQPIDFYVPFRKEASGYKYEEPVILPGTMKVFPATGGQ